MNYEIALNGEKPPVVGDYVDGVGMIRSEYLLRSIESYITTEKAKKHIEEYVSKVCEYYQEKPVWYRTSELVTPEVNVLQGADVVFEEKHYTLGMRGVRRGLKYKETYNIELQIISMLSRKYKNLNILLPYIKDVDELDEILQMLHENGFVGECGIMLEIPSVFIMLEEFLKRKISNITIGINDLTMLTLGAYRGSKYHDPCHPSIIKIIRDTVSIVKAYSSDIQVNVAGYISKEFAEAVKEINIDNLIVHYKDMPKICNLPEDLFPDMGLVSDVKKLTKSRIKDREEMHATYSKSY